MTNEFKITQHLFVPSHEILSDEEGKVILKKFNIDKSQLPLISKTDPVVTEIGAKKGDIIKITRNSQTAGKAIYYRLVK